MIRITTSSLALLAVMFWPGSFDAGSGISVAKAAPLFSTFSMSKDPAEEAEDDLEDALEDLEDEMEDALDELEDEADDSADELDDEIDFEDDSSGPGSGDEDDEDDGLEGSIGDDDEDHSGSSSDDDGKDDDDDDRSGRSSDDDKDDKDDDDRSDRSGDDIDDDDSVYGEYIDDDGYAAVDDEYLVLASRSDIEDGKFDGVNFEIQHELTALDMVMVRVRIDDDDDLAESMREHTTDAEDSVADFNHFYVPDAEEASKARNDSYALPVLPTVLAVMLGLGQDDNFRGRVGMIDTTINLEHSALAGASINVRDFASRGSPPSLDHGTMIASILVGSEPGTFRGIAPGYEIFAANTFFQRPDGQVLASVESLILAIDWLVAEDVPVINMSLSGPPNRLLERAIDRARAGGSIIVAAVGNGGPASRPLYPAAYPDVVAVTAIDRRMNIYVSAGRGSHLDFAAPGVDMLAAEAGGGYLVKSGTSLAAPFVSVVLSEMHNKSARSWPEIMATLKARARDLGEAGFDNIFGYGLIQASE